ncbi:transcription initiation factor IIB [Fervidicoccus fontis]|jgi:transcription initiation factor TFIIB|uniref:Transcription initiation factor IIB n=1 Tax=Fervidicoccus fontis TaxID=683846 RepID=A0A7C2VAU0_9CREN|nr:transcription initiation factor IIB [Fervidicoccus fontis]MBE9391510.1 transcription initiation factor IIB [Fervidicoccus fontis]HEW64006.1 transcription initiation factor IIB [Fervidicoccus fontis]
MSSEASKEKKKEEARKSENESGCPPNAIVFDPERGEYICTETGEVLEQKLVNQGPEWRAFTPEEKEKRSRIGGPLSPTVHDRGLTTLIDWRDRDASGKKLEPKKRLEFLRYRKWQIRSRIQSSIDRNLAQAMNELDRLSNQLHLNRAVREEAAVIYRKAVEKGLVRGRSIESVIAASVYVACRLKKLPRTLDEISLHTRANRKEIARCYRLLVKELQLKVPIADPIDYIPRMGSLLDLSGKAMNIAARIVKIAKQKALTAGKDPAGLAAAAIYVATLLENEKRTQKEIANIAGVTEVTVRNRYKELVNELKLDIPEED